MVVEAGIKGRETGIRVTDVAGEQIKCFGDVKGTRQGLEGSYVSLLGQVNGKVGVRPRQGHS